LASLLKGSNDQVYSKIEQLLIRNKELEKELSTSKQKAFSNKSGDLTNNVIKIADISVLVHRLDGFSAGDLRDAIDHYKNKLGSAIIVLGSAGEGKAKLAVGVTKDNTDRIRAGDLIKSVAAIVGGKGGGRADFAQAGGPDEDKLDAALESVSDLLKAEL